MRGFCKDLVGVQIVLRWLLHSAGGSWFKTQTAAAFANTKAANLSEVSLPKKKQIPSNSSGIPWAQGVSYVLFQTPKTP